MSITCPHCSKEFPGERLNSRHVSICNPESKVPTEPCLCGHDSTSQTQMKRHRTGCAVWQTRDKEAVKRQRMQDTSMKRYGVADGSQAPEAVARRVATNKALYGAENPFSKESSVFNKVQASLEGKRPVLKGADNPFANPEVQKKIRITMLDKYGVVNPQQVPEIREQTRQTNLDRYGVEEVLAAPEVRARIRATCEDVYGGPAPSCSPEVQGKQQDTNMMTYGVPWTAMAPRVRRKQLETMAENYGGHFFASEDGKARIREALVAKYGVFHWMKTEGAWEKVLATFQAAHPGVSFPGLMARPLNGPNKLEQKVLSMHPFLTYTGDRSFWRWLPKLGHNKNPDFIVPGPDPEHPKRGVTKVVEAFGDFWHSRMVTGRAPFDHEQELVVAYKEIGIDCLVLWESEVKSDPETVRTRLQSFLAG